MEPKDIVTKISTNSQSRIDNDNYYSLINDRAKWIKSQQSNKSISLNFDIYNNYLSDQREKKKV